MAYLQLKNDGDFYLVDKEKSNGQWKNRYINLGKVQPTLWRPQLINDKAETILSKLPDESIDLIITDPPYGIGFKGNQYLNKAFDVLANDDSLDYLGGIGKEFARVLRPNTHCYVFTRWDSYPAMAPHFMGHLELETVLIWDKDTGGHGMGDLADFAPRYEMIMKFTKGRRPINGSRDPNVIRHQDVRFTGEPKIHPTQKPRGLMEYLIEKSSERGDVVADFYAGSYSVPRAAMRTFRRSLGVELFPQTAKKGKELIERELHNDPVYGVDWAAVRNLKICDSAVITS